MSKSYGWNYSWWGDADMDSWASRVLMGLFGALFVIGSYYLIPLIATYNPFLAGFVAVIALFGVLFSTYCIWDS